MRLVLDVTSFQKALMGSGSRHEFDESGGAIGRSRRSDWVLPDPDRFVSATHAEVSFDGDRFYITDVSTNGLFLNDSSVPLGKGARWPVSSGDRMALGDFEIVARIEEDAAGMAATERLGAAAAVDIDSLLDSQDAPAEQPAPPPPSPPPPSVSPPRAPPPDVSRPIPESILEPASPPPSVGPSAGPASIPPPPPRFAPRSEATADSPPATETAPTQAQNRPAEPAPPPGLADGSLDDDVTRDDPLKGSSAETATPAESLGAEPPGTEPSGAEAAITASTLSPPPLAPEPKPVPAPPPGLDVGPAETDTPRSAPVREDHAAAIADLDLDDLIGPGADAPAPEPAETPQKPSPPTPASAIPPPPPLPADIDDLLGGPIETPSTPVSAPQPAAVPAPPPPTVPAPPPRSPLARVAPERIEAGLDLDPALDEATRKAKLWDEFTRVYNDLLAEGPSANTNTGGHDT